MQSDIFFNIELAKNGDKDALEYIVQHNTGLVWSIVRKFLNRGHEADDLFQTGCIGLIKAVHKFDASFEVQFSTYAVPMIMGEIKRFIRDDGIIKVSRSLKELSLKGKITREILTKELYREPTIGEIAERVGVSTEELVMAMDASSSPDSLHTVSGDDNRELIDKIVDNKNLENEIVDKLALKEALSSFKPRERQIIILRYFSKKTQTQIAQMLGISQVQVSRIEKKVLFEMRSLLTQNKEMEI